MQGATTDLTADVSATVRAVERHFHRIFEELARWHDSMVEAFDAGPVTAAIASAAILTQALAFLDGSNNVVGGGFVAARGALVDRPLYLAWWQGEERSLLAEPSVPPTEVFDYTRRPWFSVPEQTGRRHLTGPYVDFVCTDDYTVTATAPVMVNGTMVGVVGADTLVETLEGVLLPGLRESGATLVNEYGRAVVSSDPHVGPGDRIELTGRRVECRDLPLAVVLP